MVLPAGTWVMLAGQMGALLAGAHLHRGGHQTPVHSGSLTVALAAKHEANVPQFRRHSGKSQASPL